MCVCNVTSFDSRTPPHPVCPQLGHDGATPESCWLVDELSVAVPTKGVKYVFACKCWLAKDRGDGLTSRVFNVLDAEAISICKRVRPRERALPKGFSIRNDARVNMRKCECVHFRLFTR